MKKKGSGIADEYRLEDENIIEMLNRYKAFIVILTFMTFVGILYLEMSDGGMDMKTGSNKLFIMDTTFVYMENTFIDTMEFNKDVENLISIGSHNINIVEGESGRPKTMYGKKVISEQPVSAYDAPTPPLQMMSYTAKDEHKLAYIERYRRTAQQEMDRFGIPASISLAQGLLESDSGNSTLASKNNNHFGIKCFTRGHTDRMGHCTNYEDDKPTDRFRNFDNVWLSWRAHSKVLLKSRYSGLFKLKITDYKGWAYGLRKAGYATDPIYGQKLINIIDKFELHKYDTVDGI